MRGPPACAQARPFCISPPTPASIRIGRGDIATSAPRSTRTAAPKNDKLPSGLVLGIGLGIGIDLDGDTDTDGHPAAH
jgi:hypothetical protein